MTKIHKISLLIILLLGLGIRLYKITNPIADWHSWRQADTAAVTRNFVKYGVDIFQPRYDDFSDVSGKGLFNPQGFRSVEFPIFNLVHYLFYSLIGLFSIETWGRLTAVITTLISAVLLHSLVRRHASETVALLTAAFFLFLPYNIFFTRLVLPDPMMVTLCLAALLLFDTGWIVTSSLVGAIAVMVKPTAMFLLFPMLGWWWQQYRLKFFKDKSFWIWSLGMVLPFLLWRIWEYRHPEGVPASWWLLNGNGIRFKGAFFQWIFGERIGHLILGSWGIYPLIQGLILAGGYWMWWVVGALLYLFTFATGNIQHDYYQIPIIPVLAILLALGTAKIWNQGNLQKVLVVVTVAFMMAFSWYEVRGRYQINHYAIVNAGKAVDRLVPKDAVVLAPYNGDTAFLYQTARRGFPFVYFPIKDFIDNFHVTYYVSVNYDTLTREVMNKYIVVEQTPDYVIVKLEEPNRS